MRKGSAVTPCVICENPADWQSPTGHWACQTCRDDFPKVAQFRDQVHQRAVQRQRIDAAAARLEPTSPTSLKEMAIRRDTAKLYAKVTRLAAAGKLRWNDHKSTWVARPIYTTRTDSTRPPSYTVEELLSRFDRVRRNGKGWTGRCPAHTDKRPSLAITEGDKGWLLKCWAGCTFDEILHASDLKPSRMFYR